MGGLFSLRSFQTQAIDGLRESLHAGHRRPMLMLPTGAGKTVIAAHIIDGAVKKGKRIAFVVPLISLIDQSFDRFKANGFEPGAMGVIQGQHAWRRPHAKIQICSCQTISRRDKPEADIVIVDEAHIQHRAVYEWMDEDQDRCFVGLSATPWSRGLGDYYNDLIKPATISQLIQSGDLSPFRCFAPSRPDLSGVAIVAGDYHEGQLSAAMSRKELIADIVRTWLETAEDRPTLLFAVDRAHAASLNDRFAAAGVSSAYVDGETPLIERKRMVDDFHGQRIKVICSIGTMNAGIDLDVRCIIFARPTKSEILYVQSIGRGLRRAPGKDSLLVLDHSNTTLELGLVTDIDHDRLLPAKVAKSVESIEEIIAKENQKPRECPACQCLMPRGTRRCAECGFQWDVQTDVREMQGRLMELTADFERQKQAKANREILQDDKAQFFAELQGLAEERGYKPGWAAHKYKQRFGVWPNAYGHVQSTKAGRAIRGWVNEGQRSWASKRREASQTAWSPYNSTPQTSWRGKL